METGAGVEICTGCGTCAPSRRVSCENCSAPFPAARVRVPNTGACFWVAVRGGFTCRSCGFLAPLDHLPEGDAIECAGCGLRQAFETSSLAPVLALAHGAGDLGGPITDGRTPNPRIFIGADNPFKWIGMDRAFDEIAGSMDRRPLKLEAGPGHPICATCKVPLEAGAVAGVVSSRCPSCNNTERFTLPDGYDKLCSGLVGVVSPDHGDRPRAKQVVGAGGVVALACPSCGAPISGIDGKRSLTCNFCHAMMMISARAAAQTTEAPPKPAIWWLLFEGPSPKRIELETPVIVGPPTDGAMNAFAAQLDKFKVRGRAGETKAMDIAPEAPGIGMLQLAVSAVAALVVLAIAYPIASAISPDISPPSSPAHRAPNRTRHR